MINIIFLMNTTVSFIIPAWNEETIIPRTCIFLKKLELPFNYSELIFIAGGNDDTFKICRNSRLENFNKVITIRQSPGDFKSGALIKGINLAKGNFIMLIDADTLIARNFAIEVVKSLKKYDAVNCNFLPMVQKGFWYNYYIIDKLCWAKNHSNLSSLFGATTISLRKDVINEIGIENFFTKKSTAGVDHFMGIMLKNNNKRIGFVKNTLVITPRPDNLRDFIKDRFRWFSAFFQIYKDDKKILFKTLFLSVMDNLFPPLLLFRSYIRMINIFPNKYSKIKLLFTLFIVEYLLNFLRIKAVFDRLTNKSKFLGHFKGARYII